MARTVAVVMGVVAGRSRPVALEKDERTMITYAAIFDANAEAFQNEHAQWSWFAKRPTWGPLNNPRLPVRGGSLYRQLHKLCMAKVAQHSKHLYGLHYADAADIVSMILIAALAGLAPELVPFAAFLKPILTTIIRAILASIQTASVSGSFMASPGAYQMQLQDWADEAEAA